jgi:hypothetical protein
MPKLVKNYCLITYDDLCENFTDVMNKIRDSGLKMKNNIEWPLNIKYYKCNKRRPFVKKVNRIPKEKIMEKLMSDENLLFYERLLFPKLVFSKLEDKQVHE